ncbi:MAG: LPS export ABC transporter periplasmic protein LptC [Acidobacteriota bacterium]|nr:MAG: LPS export ABC transporter periplasmic protein LptC [Acidobacteriota bacterium]
MTLLVVTIGLVITAFIRARRQPRPPGPVHSESRLKANVTAITEGYKYVRTEKGREKVRLLAAKDVAYEDGRHEMEKVDLTAFGKEPGRTVRIVSDRGTLVGDQNAVIFEGNVRVTSSDGLEVTTPLLKYDQLNEVASTDSAIAFRRADLSGSAIGAQLYARTRNLALLRDVHLVSRRPGVAADGGLPVEIRSQKADYAELDGVIRFSGKAIAVQGGKSARAEIITGIVDPRTKKIVRIELRGNAALKSDEQGRVSDLAARDIDFHFDPSQHLTLAVARGGARTRSLEKDAPRELSADSIEAVYKPIGSETRLRSVVTQGRTILRIEEDGDSERIAERVIEADALESTFRDDGKSLSRAEARGKAVMTITPKRITDSSDRKILRAAAMTAEFAESGNRIRTFTADQNAVAEFEPQQAGSKRNRRTMSGQKMTARMSLETQEVADLIVEGGVKFTDGGRQATAQRAVYDGDSRIVTLRGKPQLWDDKARGSADEIDANLDTGESFLRGRVRTTYYSRESTGGAAPFEDRNAPVTIASERAVVKHREGAARFTGNVRAWQDNDFVRAENIELDNGEKTMSAWGNAQSAFYDFEREAPGGKKEVVPVFASADRINYNGGSKTIHYEGTVRIKQGTDRIDAAQADAVMDDQNRLVTMSATGGVVMSQPMRRGTGDKVVYTVATDTVELTGKQAMVEDLESRSVTKSAKLTLHFRDARIEANDGEGTKTRVRTTHRIPK